MVENASHDHVERFGDHDSVSGMSYEDMEAKLWVTEHRLREALRKLPQSQKDGDPVERPSHYTFSKTEVIDVIRSLCGQHWCDGAAVKYLARAGRKGDAIQDLKKAAWMLERTMQKPVEVCEDKAIDEWEEHLSMNVATALRAIIDMDYNKALFFVETEIKRLEDNQCTK